MGCAMLHHAVNTSSYQTISMALVCANARVYDASLERMARTVGRQFEAGSSVPIGVESF